jgi:hypothetical protein
MIKRLGGWSQTGSFEGYGKDAELPMLKKAIDKIEYPGVKFHGLRLIKRN